MFRHDMLLQQNVIGLSPNAVEYLDENGYPLFIAPENRARQIGLTRRWIAVALLAPRRKEFCLHLHQCTYAPFVGQWGISVCGSILYGESSTDAGLRLVNELRLQRADRIHSRKPLQPTMTFLREISPRDTASILPPEHFGRISLTLLRGRYAIPVKHGVDDLWLDATECSAFFKRYDNRLTPLLRFFIENGILFTGN